MSDSEWDGRVIEVWEDNDTFTVDLRREGSPDLLAEMSMAQTGVTVATDDLLIVTPATPGRPASVTKRIPRQWTQAELDQIMRRSRKRMQWLRWYTE
jgi:hypothetical protein